MTALLSFILILIVSNGTNNYPHTGLVRPMEIFWYITSFSLSNQSAANLLSWWWTSHTLVLTTDSGWFVLLYCLAVTAFFVVNSLVSKDELYSMLIFSSLSPNTGRSFFRSGLWCCRRLHTRTFMQHTFIMPTHGSGNTPSTMTVSWPHSR